jgi:Protein of unknown function (DUF3761)
MKSFLIVVLDSGVSGAIGGLIILTIILGLYCVPGILATARHAKNAAAVWVIDIFLGWTQHRRPSPARRKAAGPAARHRAAVSSVRTAEPRRPGLPLNVLRLAFPVATAVVLLAACGSASQASLPAAGATAAVVAVAATPVQTASPTPPPAPPAAQAPAAVQPPPVNADPYPAATAAGASAVCADHTWSYSKHRSGTCSSHGGVHWWTGNLGPAGPGAH